MTARLTGALFTPAPDPRAVHAPPDRLAETLERVSAASAAAGLVCRRLEQRVAAGEERLAAFEQDVERVTEASHPDASFLQLLRERQQLALREQRFLVKSLRELQSEQRRLQILQDRLRIQAETLALRHEIASARRSAARARYDAGESMLDTTYDGVGYDLLLEDAEERALEAVAQADAVEQMLAAWHVDDDR